MVVNLIPAFSSKFSFLFYLVQGTTVRVEFGDSTTPADPAGAHVISQAFPHTYGQPLAHFLRATANVPDAQIITEHPPIRCFSGIIQNLKDPLPQKSYNIQLLKTCVSP